MERSTRRARLLASGSLALLSAFAVGIGCGDSDPKGSSDGGTSDGGPDATALDGSPSDAGDEPDAAPTGPARLYVGSSEGNIYVYAFDKTTFGLELVDTQEAGGDPSFLAMDPTAHFLYAVDSRNDEVQAFTVADDGSLTPLQTVSSGGDGPTHVSVDKSGRYVMVANYGGGSVSIYPRSADGRLGERMGRSYGAGSEAHQIVTDPNNGFAFVPTKGRDAVGVLRLADDFADAGIFPSGDGARHIDFHPGGRFAYVIDELGSTVTAFSLERTTGALARIDQQPSLEEGRPTAGNTGAEVQVLPDGRHLIVSNRGDDSLMVMAIASNGTIARQKRVATGRTPRHFSVDVTGAYLFVGNAGDGDVTTMTVDRETGEPTPVGSPLEVPSPQFAALFYINR